MSKAEKILGNICIAFVLIIVIGSFFYTVFSLAFGDYRNVGRMYGSVGNYYMSE